MFCEHFRLKISESLDAGVELPTETLKHIAKCNSCKLYFESVTNIDKALECEPNMLENYNFKKMNKAISAKIDATDTIDTKELHYPTLKYSNKIAIAATFIIVASLAFSIFVNSTNSKNGPSNIEVADNTPTITAPEKQTGSSSETSDKHIIKASPQMALLYQIYANVDKEDIKETVEGGKEIIEKTQEITEKSHKAINEALKHSHFISLLF